MEFAHGSSALHLAHSPSIKDRISGPTAFDQTPMALRSSIKDKTFSFRNLPQRAASFARNGSIMARGPEAHTLPKVESIKKIAESEQRRKSLAALTSNETPQPHLQVLSSFKRSSLPVGHSNSGHVKPLPSILDQQHMRFMNYQAQESIRSRNSDPFPKQSPVQFNEAKVKGASQDIIASSHDLTSPLAIDQELSSNSIFSSDSSALTTPIPSADITPELSRQGSRRNSLSGSRNVRFGSVDTYLTSPVDGCLSDSTDALMNRSTSIVPSRRFLQRQEARGRHDETFAEVSSKLLAMLEPRYKRNYDHSSFQMARQSLGI